MTDFNVLARDEITRLRAGEMPNGHAPEEFGPWRDMIHELHEAARTGGRKQVESTVTVLVNADLRHGGRGIVRLLANNQPNKAQSPKAHTLAPELPAQAKAVYEHLEPCGHWLTNYVAFASEAAPMTPRALHEAAGLFAASMAIARRLCCVSGTHVIYPNLYFLFVSPSTIDHKTTGLRVLQSVIRDAGIGHLLMPARATPQALVADLDYGKLPTPRQLRDREFYLARRAFAAQRGWIREEASALFASFNQEFNTGLLELILDLYDCSEDGYEELTVSRGESRIERPYLSFFGVSTPVEMAPHFSNLSYWSNGLWARCLVLTPDDDVRPFRFFPKTAPQDRKIVQELQHLYRLFPVPTASLETNEDENGKREQYIRVQNITSPAQVVLAPGVWEAWEHYTQAVTHTFLVDRLIEDELFACYGRLGTLAIKVAMLLAAMDTDQLPVVVELRHYATAQQRVEAWRAGLHRLWSGQSATNETRLMERIIKRLENANTAGMTVRDLCIALRQSAKDVNDALALLAKSGKVISLNTKAVNGRQIEVWLCA